MDWIVYVLIGLLLIVFLIVLFVLLGKYKVKRKNNEIIELIKEYCEIKGISDYKLELVKKDAYDFYYEDDNDIIYIKIVNNPYNREICINNAIKWQIRSYGASDEMVFVEGIDGLMRLDLQYNGKNQKKLYIVYPQARSLLKVINECEMVFIYPNTDVYGAKVITYRALKENPILLELEDK